MDLVPVVFALLLAGDVPEKVDLRGTVRDGGGAPLKGATVLILTAQPRKGVAKICPTCYVDCWRQATTDENGRFSIDKVDASLLYRVAALTPAHEPGFVAKADPAEGEAQITLSPKAPLPESPRRVVRGRLLDLDGKAVPHAILSAKSGRAAKGTTLSKVLFPGAPPVAITDGDGRFVVIAPREADVLTVEVMARGLATIKLEMATGVEERRFSIGPGCAIRGRALRGGKPAAGLTFGVMQVYQSSDTNVGEASTAVTNAEGRWLLANVVPNDVVAVYSKLADAGAVGATPLRYVETTDDGCVVDLGDLPVAAGVRLTGRVVMPDGRPLPPDSSITVGRTAADFALIALREDGTFSVDVVPNEPLTLQLGVLGYRFAPQNGRVRERIPLQLEGDRELTLQLEAEAWMHAR